MRIILVESFKHTSVVLSRKPWIKNPARQASSHFGPYWEKIFCQGRIHFLWNSAIYGFTLFILKRMKSDSLNAFGISTLRHFQIPACLSSLCSYCFTEPYFHHCCRLFSALYSGSKRFSRLFCVSRSSLSLPWFSSLFFHLVENKMAGTRNFFLRLFV